MQDRIHSIGKNILKILKDEKYIQNNLKHVAHNHHIQQNNDDIHCTRVVIKYPLRMETPDYYLFLLRVTCEFNLLFELDLLLDLEMKEFDINARVSWDDSFYPKTLLGIAAFYGHIKIVKYLIQERLADVNASQGLLHNTPLHEVIRGDFYSSEMKASPNPHAEIAQYLLGKGALITIINKDEKTPKDLIDEYSVQKTYRVPLFSEKDRFMGEHVKPIIDTACRNQYSFLNPLRLYMYMKS